MDKKRILIADDQADVLEALRFLLKAEGYQTEAVSSPAAVLNALETRDYDALIMDLNYTRDTTSGQEGLDLLGKIQATDPTIPVIVMTAWGSVELAVEAMRRGARDFIQKPWDNARLVSIVSTQLELERGAAQGQRLEAENRLLRAEGKPLMIAESPAMQPVLQLIARVGPSDANVLITGEPGTGKEVVARTLHAISERAAKAAGDRERRRPGRRHLRKRAFRPRERRIHRRQDGSRRPLRAGRRRHAVPRRDRNVPLNLQAKLLRVLEIGEMERVGSSKTKHVNVRIISATNANLARRSGQQPLSRGSAVPPEHDRDSPAAAARAKGRYSAARVAFPQRLRAAISQAPARLRSGRHAGADRNPWQGNVRELNHVVERAVLLAQDTQVRLADLALAQRPAGLPVWKR